MMVVSWASGACSREETFQLGPLSKCGFPPLRFGYHGVANIRRARRVPALPSKGEPVADIEKTFIMIKPDAVRDRKTGLIIDRIERCGLTIEKMEKCELDEDLVKVHYAHLADKPFFGDIVDFMTSGPVVKMVVSGLSAVSKMRTLMGATNPLDAAPGTIRGDFANDVNANIIHGSDSLENAAIEIERFFG